MSQEEVIASRASALQLVVASWLVLDVEKSGLFTNGIDCRTCCSTVGSLSRPTLFVKNPLFVRPSVHPSVYTKIARFCNFPRSCSIYKPCFSTTHCQCALLSFTKHCLLPSLAGPLNNQVDSVRLSTQRSVLSGSPLSPAPRSAARGAPRPAADDDDPAAPRRRPTAHRPSPPPPPPPPRMIDARGSQIERRAPRLARCQPSSRGTSN